MSDAAFEREKADMIGALDEPVVDTANIARRDGRNILSVGGREYVLSQHDVHSLYREVSRIVGSA